ncbi:tautomerase family protein [Streptomyces sp. NPDC048018]|uniref:tautomerase family protein n=1 Tax=Streptomyces sp. NPDC048018 TaxID=3365499 RepID=UPI00371142DC
MDISYYDREFTDEQKERLGRALADVVVEHFSTYDGAVSVSLHPVEREDWTTEVFEPRITGLQDRLIKAPDYRSE